MQLHHVRRGNGEPLLLIQGMSGTHAAWGEPFMAELEDGFETVAYDHRGIGFSPKVSGPFSIADLADDAAALLDAIGWESAHVLGISMGGMVAQELALRHGERIRTLALGCTYCGGPGATLIGPEDGQRFMAGFSSGDREVVLRTGFELNTSPAYQEDPANFEVFREMALAVPARLPTIMLQMQAISAHDTQDRLASISAPTLVVHGTVDRMVPYPNAQLIASKVPDARLAPLEDVGHMFWWERPSHAAALLREHAGVGAAA